MRKLFYCIALFILFLGVCGQPVGAAVPWHQIAPEQRQFSIAQLAANAVLSGLDNFNPVVDGYISSVAVQQGGLQDGKILIGGNFKCIGDINPITLVCLSPPDGYLRDNLARFNPDGTIDATFIPNPNGVVEAISVNETDGSFIVAGSFTTISGATHNQIAKFNANGSIDTGFTAGVDVGVVVGGGVYAVQYQSDNKILIGGSFSTITTTADGTVTRKNLARLNADGSLDTTFDPNIDDDVFAIDVQPDGHIVIGGIFTHVNVPLVPRNYVARLKSDGGVETDAFASLGITSADISPVRAVKVHTSGDIFIGGKFNITSTTPTIQNLVRTGFDGVINASFKPQPNNAVDTLFMKLNGEILAGGLFTGFLQSGDPARNRLALIQNDLYGTVDATFAPDVNSEVYSVVEQPDGKILVGGNFSNVDGISRSRIARLYANLYKSSAPVTIAANAATPSVINVPPGCSSIIGLKLALQVSHPTVGDLSFSLNHPPTGTSVVIAQQGSGCQKPDIDAIFDDTASVSIGTQCAVSPGASPVINGVVQPSNPLSFFDRVSPSGNWTLTVTNNGSTPGTINGWGLVLNCAPALTVSKTVPGPATGIATVTSTPSGIACGLTCSANYPSGREVSLSGSATGNWDLDSWGAPCSNAFGSGSFPACVVTVDGDKTVNATFVEIAGFTAPASVYAGFSAFFTDTSKHSPSSWSWDFGDSSVRNTEQNPVHIYAGAGSYDVSLYVNGDTSRFKKTIPVTVLASCETGSPVKLLPSGTPAATISEAYAGASSGNTLALFEGTVLAGADMTIDKTITFAGGYLCGFTPNPPAFSTVIVNNKITIQGTGLLTLK